VGHFCVKFDDPSSISFLDIVWKNSQAPHNAAETLPVRLQSAWVIIGTSAAVLFFTGRSEMSLNQDWISVSLSLAAT